MNYRVSFQPFLFISLEKALSILEMSLSISLLTQNHTLGAAQPQAIMQPLPRNTKASKKVEISNKPPQVTASEPVSFCLSPLRNTQPFLLHFSSLINLLHQDLEKCYGRIAFFQKGKILLEFDSYQ